MVTHERIGVQTIVIRRAAGGQDRVFFGGACYGHLTDVVGAQAIQACGATTGGGVLQVQHKCRAGVGQGGACTRLSSDAECDGRRTHRVAGNPELIRSGREIRQRQAKCRQGLTIGQNGVTDRIAVGICEWLVEYKVNSCTCSRRPVAHRIHQRQWVIDWGQGHRTAGGNRATKTISHGVVQHHGSVVVRIRLDGERHHIATTVQILGHGAIGGGQTHRIQRRTIGIAVIGQQVRNRHGVSRVFCAVGQRSHRPIKGGCGVGQAEGDRVRRGTDGIFFNVELHARDAGRCAGIGRVHKIARLDVGNGDPKTLNASGQRRSTTDARCIDEAGPSKVAPREFKRTSSLYQAVVGESTATRIGDGQHIAGPCHRNVGAAVSCSQCILQGRRQLRAIVGAGDLGTDHHGTTDGDLEESCRVRLCSGHIKGQGRGRDSQGTRSIARRSVNRQRRQLLDDDVILWTVFGVEVAAKVGQCQDLANATRCWHRGVRRDGRRVGWGDRDHQRLGIEQAARIGQGDVNGATGGGGVAAVGVLQRSDQLLNLGTGGRAVEQNVQRLAGNARVSGRDLSNGVAAVFDIGADHGDVA